MTVKKLEATTPETGYNRANNTCAAGKLSILETPANIWSQAWARVRSWFEIPFGYEDEMGFHYGNEPVMIQAVASKKIFREVFTDRALDSAMFLAATSMRTAPALRQETPAAKPGLVANPS